ncbi:sensor histidine kinase [Planctomonas psychrotolerans]|uniref:sensor histidine kinase n=1 Tax=Planctomonas psychrotolerans TaxID=2528712 RepID=UPI00123ACBEE|nr:HAMP domain-containing sensor histidine kinase [Planctomonas psychrotolerans]
MHEKISERWAAISLRTKITGVTVLLLTLGLLISGLGTTAFLRPQLVRSIDDQVKSSLVDMRIIFGQDFSGSVFREAHVDGANDSYYVALVDPDGRVMVDNRPAGDTDGPVVTGLTVAKAKEIGTSIVTLTDASGRDEWHAAVRQSNLSGSPVFYSLVVALPMKPVEAFMATYLTVFFGFGVAVVVLGAALTRLLVTSTFAPLREVERTAAAIADGDFGQRLGGATPNTEVGRLNRSLNTMLSRIDQAFADRARTIDQMRRFVGDASHELRTPLVSVRGYAELYRMGALQTPEDVAKAMDRIEKEAIRMGGLVEDLLELARLDETKPLELRPVDLYPIARDAALDTMASSPGRVVTALPPVVIWSAGVGNEVPVTPADGELTAGSAPDTDDPTTGGAAGPSTGAIPFARLARLRGRWPRRTETEDEATPPAAAAPEHVDGSVPTAAIVLAEENKIRQAVTNLLGNAVRYSPAGSPIELGVVIDRSTNEAAIEVIDHGDGIPPQIREKIFQRFWRADTSRARETGGSGLGLAIVAAIVTAHRGRVDVVDTPGGGATLRLIFPLLQNPADGSPSTIVAEAPRTA